MADHLHLKDHSSELRTYRYRMVVAVIFVLMCLGVIFTRYYSLQVVEYQQHATASDDNRIHVRSVPPSRGLILDRNGELLADNRPSYALAIVKERIHSLDSTLEELRKLLDISDEDVARFHKKQYRRRPYEPTPLRYRLTEKEIAVIAVNEHRFPGVEVIAQLVRFYPASSQFAHSVGYVGRINEREMAVLDEERYRGTHTIGKVGLEKYYEKQLLGEVGYEHVETNARGQVLRVLERTDPVPGETLILHLDSELQKVATSSLEGKRGSVVAIDVETGGILAFVSTPAYDPNLFVTGISHKDYNALNENLDLPLFNRSLQGRYPPGSTLKPMLGLAALQYKVIPPDYKVPDPGWYQLENDERFYRDWKKGGHGQWVDLHHAIAESCDTFFYDVAFKMGIDRMNAFGRQFGLGKGSNIDVPNENKALWPSRTWKQERRGLPWFPGDSLNVGIGQGDVLATPLQLALMTSILANKGQGFQPHFVKNAGGVDIKPLPLPAVEAEPIYWNQIFKGMRAVMHSSYGTARVAGSRAGYRMAGKTGTAQVVGIEQDAEYDSEALQERQRDHALFVGFAPYKKPKIAVAVIVENGEHGSSVAAPVARKVFDAFMARRGEQVKVKKSAKASIRNTSSQSASSQDGFLQGNSLQGSSPQGSSSQDSSSQENTVNESGRRVL